MQLTLHSTYVKFTDCTRQDGLCMLSVSGKEVLPACEAISLLGHPVVHNKSAVDGKLLLNAE